MYRINTATKHSDLFGAGKHGFRDGDLGAGIAPTDLVAQWFNHTQEEICRVIEAAGLVPDGATYTQLLQALQSSAVIPQHGQCRLTLSGANLLLMPQDGNRLIVNGRVCKIPAAGVALAPAGTAAATVYNIYAADPDADGTVNLLEFSATGHVQDANTGVRVKIGDASRTLVGKWYASALNTWGAAEGDGLSYFNRRLLRGAATFTVTRSNSSAVPVEVNTEIRVAMLTWDDEGYIATFNSPVANSVGGAGAYSWIAVDGAITSAQNGFQTNGSVNGNYFPMSVTRIDKTTEGRHIFTIFGATPGGVGVASWGVLAGNMFPTLFVTTRG